MEVLSTHLEALGALVTAGEVDAGGGDQLGGGHPHTLPVHAPHHDGGQRDLLYLRMCSGFYSDNLNNDRSVELHVSRLL